MNASTPAALSRVNLICHDMMLFWQDKNDRFSGIKIFLPHSNGRLATRLSTNIGGLPNLIDKKGTYALTFSRNVKPTPMGPRNKNTDLVLYDDGPSPKNLQVVGGNVHVTIEAPYPNKIRRHRIMKFPTRNPYKKQGHSQPAFDIQPKEMAGVQILTYEGVNSEILLTKAGDAPISFGTPYLLNLYLYSSAVDLPSPNDLKFFNKLLKFQDAGGNHDELDLEPDNTRPEIIPIGEEVLDDDIPRLALYDLPELPGGAMDGKRSSDPVACVDGGGS